MEDFTPEVEGTDAAEGVETEATEQMEPADYNGFEAPTVLEGIEENYTLVQFSSGDILRVDHSADLGDLLIALLLFTLIVVQAFKWVGESLRERRGD